MTGQTALPLRVLGPVDVDVVVPAGERLDRFARGDALDPNDPVPPRRPRRPGDDGRITALRAAPALVEGPAPVELVAAELVASHAPAPSMMGFPVATLATSAVTAVVAAFFFSPVFALLGVVSALAVVGRWLGSRLTARRHRRRRRIARECAGATWARTAAVWSAAEAVARRSRHTGPDALVDRADGVASPWSERLDSDEALVVSLGIGSTRVAVDVVAADSGRGTVDPASIGLTDTATLVDVPILGAVGAVEGLAVCGDRRPCLAAARWLVASTVTRIGPADLGLVVVTTADRVIDWDWTKWLPSLRRCVVVESDPLDTVVDECRNGPVLVVVDGAEPAGSSPLARLFAGRMHGSRLVWLGSPEQVPAACGTRLEVLPDGSGTVREVDRSTAVRWHGLTTTEADAVARWLAPFDDPEVVDDTGRLPTEVSIEELVFDCADDRADVVRRAWERATPRSLWAPIGCGSEGAEGVDLVADGPHALVAGTTGAGKSELLRTVVVGVAAGHPPSLVSFVLIDFKGGGAFDAVADLPHVASVVTDLDPVEAERALRGLRAELLDRERRLRDMQCSDVVDVDPEHRLAFGRLVVVVDEFAALADELPDFLDGLVDIARRGRSLGVHLVLATQRPSGVVTGQIRSNTNLRICLRVQDRADSVDVIDRPDAAQLPPLPGRAYVQRGGQGSAPVQVARIDPPPGTASLEPFVVHPAVMDRWSAGQARRTGDAIADLEAWLGGPTDAAADREGEAASASASTVGCIAELGRVLHLEPPPAPWLPPLERVTYPVAGAANPSETGTAAIGLLDDPDGRCRRELRWTPERDGLLIVGVDDERLARSAATSVCAALDRPRSSPSVFVLDGQRGGAEALRRLTALEPVIDLIGVDEPDRLVKAVEHVSAVDGPLLVVINDWAAVADVVGDVGGPAPVEQLVRLARRAGSGGTALIATARSDRDVPSRAAVAFGCRVLHRLGDPAGYLSFGLRPADVPPLRDGAVIEASSGLVGVMADVDEPAFDEIRRRAVPAEGVRRPDQVRVLGAHVARDVLPPATPTDGGWRVPIGLGLDLEPLRIEVRPTKPVVVLGHAQGGRTTTLRTLAGGIGPTEALTLVDDADGIDDGDLADRLRRVADLGGSVVVAADPVSARRFGSVVAELMSRATVIVLNPGRAEADAVRVALPDLSHEPIGRAAVVDRGRVRVVQVAA